MSTLYLDHPSWYQAAEAIHPSNRGKRFLTPSGKIEIHTEEIQDKLARTGHQSLPIYYTHPHVTGDHPTITHESRLVVNPVNPQALTPVAKVGTE